MPPLFTVVEMSRDDMVRDAMQMAADYHNVIVNSEIVILPVEPSAFSSNAAKTTLAQVDECQLVKLSLKCGTEVSRKITGTVIGNDICNIAAGSGLPILEQDITTRVAFAEPTTLVQTIFEYHPKNSAAKRISALG